MAGFILGYVFLAVVVFAQIYDVYYGCIKTKKIYNEFPFLENTNIHKKWFWGFTILYLLSFLIYTIYLIFCTTSDQQMHFYTSLKVVLYYNIIGLGIVRFWISGYIREKHNK